MGWANFSRTKEADSINSTPEILLASWLRSWDGCATLWEARTHGTRKDIKCSSTSPTTHAARHSGTSTDEQGNRMLEVQLHTWQHRDVIL